MRYSLFAAACLTAISCFAGSDVAEAQSVEPSLVAPPTLTVWSNRVFNELDKHLRVLPSVGPEGPQTGIVAVKFNCSESGAPAGVSLLRSSGNREFDRATLRAVREIVTLHPLPTGLSHEQKYVVRVLFAPSQESAKRQLVQMQREATQNNAWFDKGSRSIAALELMPSGG